MRWSLAKYYTKWDLLEQRKVQCFQCRCELWNDEHKTAFDELVALMMFAVDFFSSSLIPQSDLRPCLEVKQQVIDTVLSQQIKGFLGLRGTVKVKAAPSQLDGRKESFDSTSCIQYMRMHVPNETSWVYKTSDLFLALIAS